jgi:hypothetical protein
MGDIPYVLAGIRHLMDMSLSIIIMIGWPLPPVSLSGG